MGYDVDLFVIGAGSGGVRAARIAAGHGAKAMVAEEFRIGGTCVIRGCVPKKLLVYASRFADDVPRRRRVSAGASARRASIGRGSSPPRRREITRLSAALSRQSRSGGRRADRASAPIVDGPARVRLADGRERSPRGTSSIATGARPSPCPASKALEHAITSNEIFDLAAFPQPPAGRRRRLYRGRVRFAVSPARRRGRRGHARRQRLARLRRGHARGLARRNGARRASSFGFG